MASTCRLRQHPAGPVRGFSRRRRGPEFKLDGFRGLADTIKGRMTCIRLRCERSNSQKGSVGRQESGKRAKSEPAYSALLRLNTVTRLS
jgi:hypothetical protein